MILPTMNEMESAFTDIRRVLDRCENGDEGMLGALDAIKDLADFDPPDRWRMAYQEEARKFQQETRRTSALSAMLVEWIQYHKDAGHRAEPWSKACSLCDLTRKATELLATPINQLAVSGETHVAK